MPTRPPEPATLPWHAVFTHQEAVRKQVARALHNEIGQSISAIKMSAHLAADEQDAAQRNDDLREIVRIADDTVSRLRELYALLRPPQIDSLGLEASLRGEAEFWRARWELEPAVRIGFDEPRPAPATELAAFRLAQDLLEPQRRLTRLRIEAQHRDEDMWLSVEHDGTAPDTDTLALLTARVHAFGGGLELLDETPGAVRLHVRLPWAGASA